jgi:glycerophosphoryl diester phosphodiesterase
VRFTWTLSLCLIACSSSKPEVAHNPGEPHRLLADEILNIAHGGAAIEAPKQTMASYQRAAEANADVLEVDLHSTLDGVLVVIHDDTVDATTNGTGAVQEQTFEELRKLDAGYEFEKDGAYPYRGQGLVIPAFEELLDAFPDAYWVVEIKQQTPSIVAPVIELLRRKGAAERVIIASFKDGIIAEVRAQAPDIFTSLALVEGLALLGMTPEQEAAYVPPARFVQPPEDLLTQEILDRAHRLGLKVHPWTVNDPVRMQELIELGVDGIITDDPAALEALLDK